MRDGYFFDEHAQAIARRQYLQPGDGDILGMFRRVAREIAKAEREEERSKWEEEFFRLMADVGLGHLAQAAVDLGRRDLARVGDGRLVFGHA